MQWRRNYKMKEEVELLVMLDSYPGHFLPNTEAPTEEEALIALLALGGYDPDNMDGKPLTMESAVEILRKDGSALASLEEETILNLKETYVNSVGLLGKYVPKVYNGDIIFLDLLLYQTGLILFLQIRG